MIRVLSWITFGVMFLMISPKLRDTVMDWVVTGVGTIKYYSPWSYIGAVTCLLLFAVISNYRGASHPR